ncbi:hypothetical protein CDD83_8307 [Cordyceps sp. RAO-2017]|nr:hypothetical protein CDD83_8307 [Cordyceps sp. RAO-2017]
MGQPQGRAPGRQRQPGDHSSVYLGDTTSCGSHVPSVQCIHLPCATPAGPGLQRPRPTPPCAARPPSPSTPFGLERCDATTPLSPDGPTDEPSLPKVPTIAQDDDHDDHDACGWPESAAARAGSLGIRGSVAVVVTIGTAIFIIMHQRMDAAQARQYPLRLFATPSLSSSLACPFSPSSPPLAWRDGLCMLLGRLRACKHPDFSTYYYPRPRPPSCEYAYLPAWYALTFTLTRLGDAQFRREKGLPIAVPRLSSEARRLRRRSKFDDEFEPALPRQQCHDQRCWPRLPAARRDGEAAGCGDAQPSSTALSLDPCWRPESSWPAIRTLG